MSPPGAARSTVEPKFEYGALVRSGPTAATLITFGQEAGVGWRARVLVARGGDDDRALRPHRLEELHRGRVAGSARAKAQVDDFGGLRGQGAGIVAQAGGVADALDDVEARSGAGAAVERADRHDPRPPGHARDAGPVVAARADRAGHVRAVEDRAAGDPAARIGGIRVDAVAVRVRSGLLMKSRPSIELRRELRVAATMPVSTTATGIALPVVSSQAPGSWICS